MMAKEMSHHQIPNSRFRILPKKWDKVKQEAISNNKTMTLCGNTMKKKQPSYNGSTIILAKNGLIRIFQQITHSSMKTQQTYQLGGLFSKIYSGSDHRKSLKILDLL